MASSGCKCGALVTPIAARKGWSSQDSRLETPDSRGRGAENHRGATGMQLLLGNSIRIFMVPISIAIDGDVDVDVGMCKFRFRFKLVFV